MYTYKVQIKYKLMLSQDKSLPILVETSATFITKMLSKDGFESPQASRSFNVTNKSYNHHGWSFDDRDTLNNFLLVGF